MNLQFNTLYESYLTMGTHAPIVWAPALSLKGPPIQGTVGLDIGSAMNTDQIERRKQDNGGLVLNRLARNLKIRQYMDCLRKLSAKDLGVILSTLKITCPANCTQDEAITCLANCLGDDPQKWYMNLCNMVYLG